MRRRRWAVRLILGVTGMFGSRVLRETAARGVPVRALARSPDRAAELELEGVEVAVGDLEAPDSLRDAFAGVDAFFLVSAMSDRIEVQERNAIRAAEQAGVRRVVKLYGAVRHREDPLDVLHKESIDAIQASGLSWALVSPNSVMETSLLSQAEAVRSANALFGCAGDGRVGLVAADDVARAAAVVLIEREESGVNYELTGPAAVTMAEMAATMTEVLGRAIAYEDMREDEFRKLLVEEGGVPEDVVDIQVLLHFAAWKRGDAEIVTDTYRELTGEDPTSLAHWLALNRQAFESPEPEQQAPETTTG
jgi:uncharacterized protein YbjT (DUF2867 family)